MSQGELKLQNVCVMAFVLALSGCETPLDMHMSRYSRSSFEKIQHSDYRGALDDLNKGVKFELNNPNVDHLVMVGLYRERADLKCFHLADPEGALEDYSENISHAEKIFESQTSLAQQQHAYRARARCKETVLKDGAGARADYALADLKEARYADIKKMDDAYYEKVQAKAQAERDRQYAEEAARKAQGPSVWELNAEAASKKLKEMQADHSHKTSPYYGTGCNGSSSCR